MEFYKYLNLLSDLLDAIVRQNIDNVQVCAEELITLTKKNKKIKDYESEVAEQLRDELDCILDEDCALGDEY